MDQKTTEAGEILQYLERENLFLIPLDKDRFWYRSHSTFARILRHRRQRGTRERTVNLHLAASAWHAAEGDLLGAIRHWIGILRRRRFMRSFNNKVAVITGAASGIGRSLACQLAAKGARLAISDVNAEGLAETKRLIGTGALVKTYRLDVSSREAFYAHAEEVKKDFGTAHYVFNNAGVADGKSINDSSIEDFEWLLGINLWGVIYGTKAFLPQMLEQKEGCIVNVSSVFGLITVPYQGSYHVAKYGVRGFTECLWRELKGTGVRAVVVHPGGIDTSIAKNAEARIGNAKLTEEQEKFRNTVQKNLTGSPDDCARQIVRGLEKGKKRILAGPGSKFLFFLSRWFPNSYGTIMELIGY